MTSVEPGTTRLLLLGPVEAWHPGRRVMLGRRRERGLLAVLLLEVNQLVPAARLTDLLWDGAPPGSARASLHSHVSRLRAVLDPDGDGRQGVRLLARGGGYLVEADRACIDAHRFTDLVQRARAGGDPATRAAMVRSGLALWRGDALAGAGSDLLRQRVAGDLEQLRLTATELAIDADLACGRHDEVIGEVTRLVGEHPLREELWARLALALYRAGRQADALQALARARDRLADEAGIDPGNTLQRLQFRMLNADPALATVGVDDDADAGAAVAAEGIGRDQMRVSGPVVVPRQLPMDPAEFIGRRGEVDRLLALAEPAEQDARAPVVCLIEGMAGVGKTALAVHIAHRVADRFPDGQLYVNLRGFDPGGRVTEPAEAVRGFLDALGVPPDRIPRGLDAQVALYRSLLADRRMLVVLDNARDPEQVRPLLAGTSATVVLVTSRNRLTGLVATEGAVPVSVDLLSTLDARELLARRLGTERVAAEPQAVERIISACARLPLALAIAAARARQSRFPLAAVANELGEGTARLDALDTGDAGSQVRAVFSWSYATLTPQAARLFRLLGLHACPDISVPAAASLAALTRPQTGRLLVDLARANLVVEHAPGRYIVHDLLRMYAGDLAQAEEPDGERRVAIRRLVDHYLHTAYAADRQLYPRREPVRLPPGPAAPDTRPEGIGGDGVAMAWFDTEHRVLLAVQRLAVDSGLNAQAWQLAWALDGFLYRRGHWSDDVLVWRHALTAAGRLGDLAAQAIAHRTLGRACAGLGRHATARTHLNHALDLFSRAGDHIGQAYTHNTLTGMQLWRGDAEQALDHSRQALALFQAAGHLRGQALALNSIGWCQALLGKHADAVGQCEQALALFHQLDDWMADDAVANTWDSLGYAHHKLGNYAQAADCYRQALAVHQRLDNRYDAAVALDHLGDTHEATGNQDAARAAWREALDILDGLGRPEADEVRTKLSSRPRKSAVTS